MKYSGKIGFADEVEKEPGVWLPDIVEKHYFGEVSRFIAKSDQDAEVTVDQNVNNEISIIADTYAMKHIAGIRYICWLGVKWRVGTVQINYPRLVLSIGGLYNNVKTESGSADDPGNNSWE